jgi:hypothetical protein
VPFARLSPEMHIRSLDEDGYAQEGPSK